MLAQLRRLFEGRAWAVAWRRMPLSVPRAVGASACGFQHEKITLQETKKIGEYSFFYSVKP